jgi:hypothetical protein
MYKKKNGRLAEIQFFLTRNGKLVHPTAGNRNGNRSFFVHPDFCILLYSSRREIPYLDFLWYICNFLSQKT